jgi:hypothetical protein
LKDKEALYGYLDRLRANLETLDSAIDDAKKMSKKGAEGRARLKAIRDLVELRNTTLEKIKVHLLGRDETGAPNEPDDLWNSENSQVMFERYFKGQLEPWTRKDLELECKDCGKSSEGVSNRDIEHGSGWNTTHEYVDLCASCYEKRKTPESKKEETSPLENETIDLNQLLKWKKELEDASVPCPKTVDIPDMDKLAENIKELPPESKARLIEFCKQRGTPAHILKRLGLET